MFSTNNKNNCNQENINPEYNKENNNENNNQNSFIDLNSTLDNTIKINREYKHNIPALKRIENILSSNGNCSYNKNTFKTELKPSKVDLNKNINKTFAKPINSNIFQFSNDEKYSLLKIKKIKSKKFSPYKSTNQLYNNVENIYDDEINEYKNIYFKMNKNKKIYSLRKEYMSIITYKDENDNDKEFKLFRDNDIGLNNGPKIKNLLIDDDLNSDDETINNGKNRCMKNIGTAINLMQKNNKEYVSKYIEHMENNSLK